MARKVDNEAQFSTFSLVKSALKASSVISKRFKDNDFYEYEPNLKSFNIDIPYIVIKVPSSDTDLLVLSHESTLKDFEVDIIMVNDWEARSNVLTYINAVVKALEDYENTFLDSGYFDTVVELESSESEVIDEKQVISSIFTLAFNGQVNR